MSLLSCSVFTILTACCDRDLYFGAEVSDVLRGVAPLFAVDDKVQLRALVMRCFHFVTFGNCEIDTLVWPVGIRVPARAMRSVMDIKLF